MEVSDEQARKNIKMWLDALRSGKYKQGRRLLRKDDEFCCLGVACDVFKSFLIEKKEILYYGSKLYSYEDIEYNKTENMILPPIIKFLLKMKETDGAMLYNRTEYKGQHVISLTYLNDFMGANFDEIANFIEENWDQIFTIPKN